MNFISQDKLKLIAGAAVAAALTAGALIASTANADTTIGQQAPDFTELNTAGDQVSKSDFAGKTVILEWTNDGCPFVQKHYNSGNMQATQEAAVDGDTVWITVISSKPGSQGYVSAQKADELTTSRGAKPTHVLLDPDGSMGRAYGAKTTPHMYIIKPGGELAYNGAIDSIPSSRIADIEQATNYVNAGLTALEAGDEPDPSLTVPYGCSVKY